MEIKSYKDLIVWQKSMDLAVEIYRLTKGFPQDELYSLTNQIRRAVVSIPSNIAEGKGRNSKAEYLHFLSIAQGSLAETETQIELAIRLSYVTELQANKSIQLHNEISKMLAVLYTKLSEI
jgi:four helix bundle protein